MDRQDSIQKVEQPPVGSAGRITTVNSEEILESDFVEVTYPIQGRTSDSQDEPKRPDGRLHRAPKEPTK